MVDYKKILEFFFWFAFLFSGTSIILSFFDPAAPGLISDWINIFILLYLLFIRASCELFFKILWVALLVLCVTNTIIFMVTI